MLDGPVEELRRDALDAICAAAVLLGPDFTLFVPVIRKAVQRHRVPNEWFERLAQAALASQPPCMSDADDWEATR